MKIKPVAILALALILSPAPARAAGFRLVEQDNAGQGQAHAITASVNDAAAVYYNPAAMVDAASYAAKAGFQFVDPKNQYSGPLRSFETANETFAVPHLYVMKNFGESGWAVGLGAFANFGTGTNWSMYDTFNYEATNTKLTSSTINLNAAKRISDTISVAVGVDYLKADVIYDSMYPFGPALSASLPDGYLNVKGDGGAFGFNVAALVKPSANLRIGVSYRSRVTVKLSGDAVIQNFPGVLRPLLAANGEAGDDWASGVEADLALPDMLQVGLAYQATERLVVEFDADYTGWSSLDKLEFKFSKPLAIPSSGAALLPATRVKTFDWKNVVALRLGAAYQYSEALTLRCGAYHDPSPVPEETFTPRLPDADRRLASLGFSYRAADNFTIDAAYSYLWTDTRSVDNTVGAPFVTVDGDYKSTTNIFGASVGYKF